MIKGNADIYLNCMLIEALVKSLVVQGITNNEELIEAVDVQFHPENEWEMEIYSEAVLYAKYAILN